MYAQYVQFNSSEVGCIQFHAFSIQHMVCQNVKRCQTLAIALFSHFSLFIQCRIPFVDIRFRKMSSKEWICNCSKSFKSKFSLNRHQKSVCQNRGIIFMIYISTLHNIYTFTVPAAMMSSVNFGYVRTIFFIYRLLSITYNCFLVEDILPAVTPSSDEPPKPIQGKYII